MVWIAHGLIEIDETVERLAGANPFVYSFALDLSSGREIARIGSALKRRQRGAKNFKPVFVCALSHLLQSGDDVFRTYRFRFRSRCAGMSQVIDAFEDDHVLDARLREHIAIEPRQPIHAESDIADGIMQDAVA